MKGYFRIGQVAVTKFEAHQSITSKGRTVSIAVILQAKKVDFPWNCGNIAGLNCKQSGLSLELQAKWTFPGLALQYCGNIAGRQAKYAGTLFAVDFPWNLDVTLPCGGIAWVLVQRGWEEKDFLL